MGVLGTLSSSPDLRAYITEALGAKNQIAANISDDEYTYDYSRIALIANARIVYDLDLSGDVGYESRHYGSVSTVKQRGIGKKIQEQIQTGADRKETTTSENIYLSKL